MAILTPSPMEQMKEDLIAFLSQEDIYINEFCIHEPTKGIDASFFNIELQVYKKVHTNDNSTIKK